MAGIKLIKTTQKWKLVSVPPDGFWNRLRRVLEWIRRDLMSHGRGQHSCERFRMISLTTRQSVSCVMNSRAQVTIWARSPVWEPTVPIFIEFKSAETLLGCNFRRLAKCHHSIDHQIHRRLSFFKRFRLSDRSQVR
jgi:hypothetical protein